MDGRDRVLRRAVVADRAPRRLDLAAQGRVGDDPVAPDRREDLLLRHRAAAVAGEKDQEVEHLRLDRDALAGLPELELGGVELEIAEPDDVGRQHARREVDPVGLDRPADVLDRLLAERDEPHGHVGADVVVDLPRQHDAARRRDALEPGRHVDPVAVDVAAVGDHVAEMEADAEVKPVPFGRGGVAQGERALDIDGALQRADDAGELGELAVAHQLDRAPGVARDRRVDDGGPRLLETVERALLVHLHQAAVADDIHRDDGCQPPVHGPDPPCRSPARRRPDQPPRCRFMNPDRRPAPRALPSAVRVFALPQLYGRGASAGKPRPAPGPRSRR